MISDNIELYAEYNPQCLPHVELSINSDIKDNTVIIQYDLIAVRNNLSTTYLKMTQDKPRVTLLLYQDDKIVQNKTYSVPEFCSNCICEGGKVKHIVSGDVLLKNIYPKNIKISLTLKGSMIQYHSTIYKNTYTFGNSHITKTYNIEKSL